MSLEFKIYYHQGCPNYTKACRIICDVVGENELLAEIKLIPVLDNKEAKLFKFKGSPTVMINGLDVEECYSGSVDDQNLLFGPLYDKNSCRLYECTQSKGCPSKAMIECALNSSKLLSTI